MENDEKDDGMCEKRYGAGRRNIELQSDDISQGVARGCALSPSLLQVYLDDR